jgi:hypothetical protein
VTCIDNSNALIITYLCHHLLWVTIYKLIYWFCTYLFLFICLRVLVNYFQILSCWYIILDVLSVILVHSTILFILFCYLNFLFLASVLTCFRSIVCNRYLRTKILIVCLLNLHIQIEFKLISVYFKFVYTKAYMHWKDRARTISE